MSLIREVVVAALWRGRDPFLKLDTSAADTIASSGATPPDEFDSSLIESIAGQVHQVIVEVGAGDGSTTMRIARQFQALRHNGVVIAVDTWLGSWEHWCEPDGLDRLGLESGRPTLQRTFMQRVRAENLQRYVVPLPLDDSNACALLKRKHLSIDRLHMDLSVSCTSVERQMKLWWPLLRGGGSLSADRRRCNQHASLQARETFKIFAAEHDAAFDDTEGLMRIDKQASASLMRTDQTHVVTQLPAAAPTIEYKGEFGPELVLFLPYVTWLSEAGLLRQTRVVTYAGMRSFYDHLQCGEYVEKHSLRRYIPEDQRLPILPVKCETAYDLAHRSPFHAFPDFRDKFRQLPIASVFDELSKPLLVIHNKFAVEWNRAPINHFSVELLDRLFQELSRDFAIVYIRHGMTPEPAGYSKDDNFTLPFDERPVLDAHPDVLCFDDVYANYVKDGGTQDMNTFKNVLYSRCYHFISSQGGGPMQMAYFSGSLLMVLHRYGREERLAYANGYFAFIANPAPTRVICLNDEELLRGVRLFQGSWIMDGKVVVSNELTPLLQELSPSTLERRRNGKWSR